MFALRHGGIDGARATLDRQAEALDGAEIGGSVLLLRKFSRFVHGLWRTSVAGLYFKAICFPPEALEAWLPFGSTTLQHLLA